MQKLQLEITLLSSAVIGSGEGFGAIIDTDIVFDDIGMPLLPGKRVKGCLRDAAETAFERFRQANIAFPLTEEPPPTSTDDLLNTTFGLRGRKSGDVYFANLTIPDYAAHQAWLAYWNDAYAGVLSRDTVMDSFTDVRQQTAIDPETGTAKDGALRTLRAARKGTTFVGEVVVNSEDRDTIQTLALACMNLRHLGTNRNRGFGEVVCGLRDCESGEDLVAAITQQLEGLCTA